MLLVSPDKAIKLLKGWLYSGFSDMGGCRILKQPGQKLRGGVLKGVSMGVVLIITGCGHLLMVLVMPRLPFASFFRLVLLHTYKF